MKANQLLESRFIQLQRQFPDDVPVRISIEAPGGPVVVVNLSALRELLNSTIPPAADVGAWVDPVEWKLVYPWQQMKISDLLDAGGEGEDES